MDEGDISFGEVETRPIEKGERPDQSREWAVTPYGEPDPEAPFRIYVDLDSFADMETHASSDTSVELGGILLGKQHVDDKGRPFVWVKDSLRAKFYESSISRFKFTHDTFAEFTREQEEVAPDLDQVGWYHTHPGWGIFLSGYDTFIHENHFDFPLHIAYVIDPCNNDRGCFHWLEPADAEAAGLVGVRATGDDPSDDTPGRPVTGKDGRVLPTKPIPGFYVVAARERRAELEDTVARVEGRRGESGVGFGGGIGGAGGDGYTAGAARGFAGGGTGVGPSGPPIIVNAGGGRSPLAAAAFAVLSLLVLAQTGVLLMVYQRNLESATRAETDLLRAQLERERERHEKSAAAVVDAVATGLQRDMLRSLTADARIGGEPFLRKYEELFAEAAALREKARAADAAGRLSATLLVERDQAKAELDKVRAERDSLASQKKRADEAERKLAVAVAERDAAGSKAEDLAAKLRDSEAANAKYKEDRPKLDDLHRYEESASFWQTVSLFALPVAAVSSAGAFLLWRTGQTPGAGRPAVRVGSASSTADVFGNNGNGDGEGNGNGNGDGGPGGSLPTPAPGTTASAGPADGLSPSPAPASPPTTPSAAGTPPVRPGDEMRIDS
jgi:proteasome lid subunit RPN8/RPN11